MVLVEFVDEHLLCQQPSKFPCKVYGQMHTCVWCMGTAHSAAREYGCEGGGVEYQENIMCCKYTRVELQQHRYDAVLRMQDTYIVYTHIQLIITVTRDDRAPLSPPARLQYTFKTHQRGRTRRDKLSFIYKAQNTISKLPSTCVCENFVDSVCLCVVYRIIFWCI